MSNFVGTRVTRTTVGPLSVGPDPGDSVFVAVTAERGLPDVPHLITSYDRYRQVFGGASGVVYSDGTRISEGDEVLRILFSKGRANKRCYVTRVVGSSAVAANVTLVDRESPAVDTLTVHAKGEGTWANAYEIVIADGTRSNTFKITVLDGDGTTVETWDSLGMTDASLQAVTDGSDYIWLENEYSASAAPLNRPATGTFGLNDDTSGVDDNAPTASDIVGTETLGVKSGLKVFRDRRYGRGFLIAPGMDGDSDVRAEMADQVESYYHIPMFGPSGAKNATTVQSDKPDALGGYYWPRPKVVDAVTDEVKAISPVGHVIADWLTYIAEGDFGKHPAGKNFRIDRVRGMETQANGQPLVDETVAELLTGLGINSLYDRDLTGVKCWAARSCSSETKWAYLHAIYLWVRIASTGKRALDSLIYETVDGDDQFFKDVRTGLREMMIALHAGGAFDGTVPGDNEEEDPDTHAFGIKADRSLLTPSDIENKNIRVKIWFKDSLTAETIDFEVAKRNVA